MTDITSSSTPWPLDPLLAKYYDDLRVRNWSATTIDRRQRSLGRFVMWATQRGIDSPTEITLAVIKCYQRFLYHSGNLRSGKPLRASTQASYLSALSHFLHWAAVAKLIPFNPAVEVELPKRELRLPANYLSHEEVEQLLHSIDTSTPRGIRDRAIIETLYSTAIRRSELLGLTPYDIDHKRRVLIIRQGKNHKDRLVPIGQRAIDWLNLYLSQARPAIVAYGAIRRRGRRQRPYEPTNRLIVSNHGDSMLPETLSQLVRSHLTAAGIDKSGSCHMLRHTTATLMLDNGADLRALQEMLGHANLNSTQIYTHVSIERLRQVHDQTHPANRPEPNEPTKPGSTKPGSAHAESAKHSDPSEPNTARAESTGPASSAMLPADREKPGPK